MECGHAPTAINRRSTCYLVLDGFWTPLFTYSGLAGLVLALALATVAIALWRKDHAIREELSRSGTRGR